MPRVRKQLSEEEKAEIEEAFELFDGDHDKHLDRDEFKVALRALGHTIKKEKFKTIFKMPEDKLCSWEVRLFPFPDLLFSINSAYEVMK